jgi:hypothetical protein
MLNQSDKKATAAAEALIHYLWLQPIPGAHGRHWSDDSGWIRLFRSPDGYAGAVSDQWHRLLIVKWSPLEFVMFSCSLHLVCRTIMVHTFGALCRLMPYVQAEQAAPKA